MTERFDRIYGQIVDISPMARPSTITEALPIAGNVTTWIVQTAAHNEGFVTFLQCIDAEGQVRLVLPNKVVAALVRQHDNLRDRITDRRSEARRQMDAERDRIAAAKRLLEKKREERRARRASNA